MLSPMTTTKVMVSLLLWLGMALCGSIRLPKRVARS